MFDASPYTSGDSQFTEEQIRSMLPASYEAWRDSYNKTYGIELSRKQEEYGLQPRECWWFPWAILRSFFQSKGYTLHQYKSQEDPGSLPYAIGPPAADSFGLYGDRSQVRSQMMTNSLLFGARDRQNRDVVIRLVDQYSSDHPEGSIELQILRLLNSPSLRSDPRNATVPVLEFLEFDDWRFVVMPFYKESDRYPLLSAQECLDFACQVAEALTFLHEHRIAHLDVSHENILMNFHGAFPHYDIMYPEPDKLPEFRSTFPVRYSFIDFGNSAYFLPGLRRSQCRIAPSKSGRPHRAPEVNGRFKHDPFAADVFQTAIFFYSYFGRTICPEVPGLLEILQDMSSIYPPDRIPMAVAARRFRGLYNTLPPHGVLPRHMIDPGRYCWIPRPKFRGYWELIKLFISEKWKTLLFFFGNSELL
ncbi:kinase-like domain-containing protein [Pholiota molesta]|nr:kinase-like domain-containing protein [Pholiota molesta]